MAKSKKKLTKKVVKKSAKRAAPKNSGEKSGVRPLADRVLVRREEMPEKKSIAGIVLPDSAQKEKSKVGVVLAVGAGRFGDDGSLIPMTVRVGDKIIFNAGWDNEVTMQDDKEYFLVRESDILAVLR